MNDVEKIDNNDVYLTLDNQPGDEFILKQNIDALIQSKNATIQRIAHELISIPAALVRLKWQNRREIYAFQVKEEIYGAAINAIVEERPELLEKIMARLEANYQHILARETATLRISRKLADEEYRTSVVKTVAPEEKPASEDAATPLMSEPAQVAK
ncbi:cytoplasmic protein [Citrobacter sp. BDA59-3]|uniref:cytoplasmic protein n=1 Tax=Citrobacter sp. BDA59-3 TaxID=2781952 RepID=UPI00188041C7|nr:cytoplasmic protein [Citrobacter sp. BDA59-3]